jgi:hypothetical protein
MAIAAWHSGIVVGVVRTALAGAAAAGLLAVGYSRWGRGPGWRADPAVPFEKSWAFVLPA